MRKDAEVFIDAPDLNQIDLLGFSVGGIAAQQVVVDRSERMIENSLRSNAIFRTQWVIDRPFAKEPNDVPRLWHNLSDFYQVPLGYRCKCSR
jgi:hypothetical protein